MEISKTNNNGQESFLATKVRCVKSGVVGTDAWTEGGNREGSHVVAHRQAWPQYKFPNQQQYTKQPSHATNLSISVSQFYL